MNFVEFILADGKKVEVADEGEKKSTAHTGTYGALRLGVEPSSRANQENPLTVPDYRYA
jgi:hypothetical protein